MIRKSIWLALVLLCAGVCESATVRVVTWNLEWFPNGSPKEIPVAEQGKRIAAAADMLRTLGADILLLQEVRDYEACAKLGEAIKPGAYQVAICSAFSGSQQVAILAKEPAQAAWAETWKSMQGVDPPRGFAFAWFKIGGADVGVYSLHLKSNLVMHGDKATETAKNISKREVAAEQVLNHIRDLIAPKMPMIKSLIVGGDFNTTPDQEEFAAETTLPTLTAAGFRNSFEGLPREKRVTHPGTHGFPDATFDYLFSKGAVAGKPSIVKTTASDHLPVVCDFTLESPIAVITRETTIRIPYGSVQIPIGTKVRVAGEHGQFWTWNISAAFMRFQGRIRMPSNFKTRRISAG